ncbi:MAG: MFS transporter [Alphaproteobacteria bacterium]|nr:MFS transporter [Alphaproteobacteria bacterium]
MTPVTVTRAASATLLATSMMQALTVAGLSAAMPSIAAHYADVPNVDYLSRLVLVAPSLVIALFAPVSGYIIDRFGRIKLLTWSIVIYGLVGGAGYFVDELESQIILRVLIGVAAAGVNTAVTTLSGDYFTGADRQNFLGFRTGLTNMTNIGINLCSGLLAAVSWRMPFLMYASVLLLVPFVTLLLFEPVRISAETLKATKPGRIVWPIAFLIGLYAASFLHNTAFYLIPVQLPFYMQALGADDPRMSGFALAMASFGLAVSSTAYAPVRRWAGGPEATFAVAFLVIAIGMISTALSTTATAAIVSVIGTGLGFGLTFVNFPLWIIDRVPLEIRGRAVGGLMTSTFFGHFCAPFWSQAVAERYGLGAIYFCGAGLCLILAAAYAFAWRRNHRSVVST